MDKCSQQDYYLKFACELEPMMDGILLSSFYCVSYDNNVHDILPNDLIWMSSLVWGLKLVCELEPKMDGILLSKSYCVGCNNVPDILTDDLIWMLNHINRSNTHKNECAQDQYMPLLSLALDDLMPNLLEWG